jgi:hypothetical protein
VLEPELDQLALQPLGVSLLGIQSLAVLPDELLFFI